MRTGYDLIALAAERNPEHLAIVDDRSGTALTYRELIREIDAVAAGLHARGVRMGDRVATALPNQLEHCLVLLALQRLAAVPAVLNFRFPAAQLAAMMQEAAVKAAVIPNDPAIVAAVTDALPASALLITVGGSVANTCDYVNCYGDPATLPAPPKPHPDDTAFIFYTSGTTGKPKGALVAHRTTEIRITSLSPITGLRAGPHLRALGASPLFHGIGFYCVFMTTLVYGGTYFLMSSFSPPAALDVIERQRITFLFAVPTILQAMLSAPNYQPEKVRSLEFVFHGGAAISSGLLDRLCKEWPAQIQHLYGTTETYIPLCNPSPQGTPNTLCAVFPHRSRLVKIGGESGDIAGVGESGELLVDATSDLLFSDYLTEADGYVRKVRDGWYFTGDVFSRRPDGDLDFVGRVDDAIRSGGECVYPTEIEDVIGAHPEVREVCVLGVPDNYWGERVVACIVRRGGGLTAQQIEEHCRTAVLASFKRPRQFVFVETLPRNASNKVSRRELRDALVNDGARLCA